DIPIPTPNSFPVGIVFGPDNAFWFTEHGANKIGRIDLSGNITEIPVSAAPGAITLGPDGALYFTETGANRIGRVTVQGDVSEIAIPEPNSGPIGVVGGPDGELWFTETGASRIGRLSFAPPADDGSLNVRGTCHIGDNLPCGRRNPAPPNPRAR